MRRFKFRAWDRATGKMLSHRAIDKSDADGIIMWGEIFKGRESDLVLMQYTGLRDRSGREIFEGDIVRWGHGNRPGPTALVRFGTLYEGDDKVRTGWIVEDCFVNDDCEVVGNHYENPELLPQAA